MIACCSDETRPVIFKIERLDYKVVYIDGIGCEGCRSKIKNALETLESVMDVAFRTDNEKNEYIELFLDKDIQDSLIADTINGLGKYRVIKID